MAESKGYVSQAETDNVSRSVLSWINRYPEKPVRLIEFEDLEAGKPSMALSTIQGAYKIKTYIYGGYLAQYQFKIVYRVQPSSNNDRLAADEVLNNLGDWLSSSGDLPEIGNSKKVVQVVFDARSSVFGAYDNGDEDHQILMTMTYEVF